MRQIGVMSLGTEHAQNNQPMSESLAHYGEPLTVTCPMRSQPKSSSRDEICCWAKSVKIQNPNTFFNSIVVDKVKVPHGDPDGTIFPWRLRDSSTNTTPLWVDTTPFWVDTCAGKRRCQHLQQLQETKSNAFGQASGH